MLSIGHVKLVLLSVTIFLAYQFSDAHVAAKASLVREVRDAGEQEDEHDAFDSDPAWYGSPTDDEQIGIDEDEEDGSLYLAARRKKRPQNAKTRGNKNKKKKKNKKKAKGEATNNYDDNREDNIVDAVTTENEGKDAIIGVLGQQLMMTQLFIEERIRSAGSSGLKQVRVNKGGTKTYHWPHYIANSIASIHDHANNIRTVGMGEVVAVLNGVEFRTRHNDYRVKQPHSTDAGYHATEDIEYPDVPPAVSALSTVPEQINEMRLWFKAFKDQDYSVRDYRPYFFPILCYLEGAWTLPDGESIEEPFDSDRHFIDASSWYDLQQKIRFTSATGRKGQLENFAFLPTTIVEMINGTIPRLAQWNYRIMCHKIRKNVATSKFRPIDDLPYRFRKQQSYPKYLESRAVRFQTHDHAPNTEEEERANFLDSLMYEVPGKDNYQGQIEDDAMGATVMHINSENGEPANAAYYHRYYQVEDEGAGGLKTRHAGFSDPNLFVALTTQGKVAPVEYEECTGKRKNRVCTKVRQRVTYAIPLEAIFMTPLSKWNPNKIKYHGDAKSVEGKTVNALNEDGDRRNGQKNVERAYNGANSKLFYRTPAEFFVSNKEGGEEPADTTRNSVGVLDEYGNVHTTRASGIRVNLPEIEGVGTIRQRYPIMPLHDDGNSVSKRVAALEEAVMHMADNLALFRDVPPFQGVVVNELPVTYTFYTSVSNKPNMVDNHHHSFTMKAEDFNQLKISGRKTYETSIDNGHSHELVVKYNKVKQYFKYISCGTESTCLDGHVKELTYEQD